MVHVAAMQALLHTPLPKCIFLGVGEGVFVLLVCIPGALITGGVQCKWVVDVTSPCLSTATADQVHVLGAFKL